MSSVNADDAALQAAREKCAAALNEVKSANEELKQKLTGVNIPKYFAWTINDESKLETFQSEHREKFLPWEATPSMAHAVPSVWSPMPIFPNYLDSSKWVSEHDENFVSLQEKKQAESKPLAGVKSAVPVKAPIFFAWRRIDQYAGVDAEDPQGPKGSAQVDHEVEISEPQTEHSREFIWPKQNQGDGVVKKDSASMISSEKVSIAKAKPSVSFNGRVPFAVNIEDNSKQWETEYDSRCSKLQQRLCEGPIEDHVAGVSSGMNVVVAEMQRPSFFVWNFQNKSKDNSSEFNNSLEEAGVALRSTEYRNSFVWKPIHGSMVPNAHGITRGGDCGICLGSDIDSSVWISEYDAQFTEKNRCEGKESVENKTPTATVTTVTTPKEDQKESVVSSENANKVSMNNNNNNNSNSSNINPTTTSATTITKLVDVVPAEIASNKSIKTNDNDTLSSTASVASSKSLDTIDSLDQSSSKPSSMKVLTPKHSSNPNTTASTTTIATTTIATNPKAVTSSLASMASRTSCCTKSTRSSSSSIKSSTVKETASQLSASVVAKKNVSESILERPEVVMAKVPCVEEVESTTTAPTNRAVSKRFSSEYREKFAWPSSSTASTSLTVANTSSTIPSVSLLTQQLQSAQAKNTIDNNNNNKQSTSHNTNNLNNNSANMSLIMGKARDENMSANINHRAINYKPQAVDHLALYAAADRCPSPSGSTRTAMYQTEMNRQFRWPSGGKVDEHQPQSRQTEENDVDRDHEGEEEMQSEISSLNLSTIQSRVTSERSPGSKLSKDRQGLYLKSRSRSSKKVSVMSRRQANTNNPILYHKRYPMTSDRQHQRWTSEAKASFSHKPIVGKKTTRTI